jgi:hypothetical protein
MVVYRLGHGELVRLAFTQVLKAPHARIFVLLSGIDEALHTAKASAELRLFPAIGA